MLQPVWRLAGVDIAWRQGNPSALAFAQLSGDVLHIEQVIQQSLSVSDMADLLVAHVVHGVAIDGPTIINNRTGMRACERALTSVYGRRGVACYPANLSLWADCQSLQLSHWLQQRGLRHSATTAGDHQQPWQIECYPHAALLELFQLPYRLAYKKGPVAARLSGQQQLAELLLRLESQPEDSSIVPRYSAQIRQQVLAPQVIATLRGASLKANEDCLDALVCVLIAAYHQRRQSHVFGDSDHGFIVVPKPTTQHRTGVE